MELRRLTCRALGSLASYYFSLTVVLILREPLFGQLVQLFGTDQEEVRL